jgi:hypothetical protein
MSPCALALNPFHVAVSAQSLERIGWQTARGAPFGYEWTNIRPESAAEVLFGRNQIAPLLQVIEFVAVDERCLEPKLLRRGNSLYHCFDLSLQVVALIDHVGHIVRQVVCLS